MAIGVVVAVVALGAVGSLVVVVSRNEPSVTAVPPCVRERHLVAFDIHGTLTTDETAMTRWFTDPSAEPEPRPGAAEVVAAYRQRGYEILYTTGTPTILSIQDQPAPTALTQWLARHQFPTGDGTALHTWDTTADESVEVTDELRRLENQGVHADAGYTNNDEDVHAYTLGGIPADHVYTLGPEAEGELDSSAIPGDDLVAHLDAVLALPNICDAA